MVNSLDGVADVPEMLLTNILVIVRYNIHIYSSLLLIFP